MSNRKNVSLIILGVVSFLFVLTLTFFSQTNTSEPVAANDTEEQQIKSNNNSNNNSKTGDSTVENSITNSINANTSEVDNTIDNTVESANAEVDNTVDNSVTTNQDNGVTNSVDNDIQVSVDVNVTNDLTNDVMASGKEKEDSDNGENGNGENGEGSDNGENGNGSNGNGNGDEETPDTVWGVDSASITTDEMLACVRENFGDPEVWGRYLGTNEGASYGLTEDEVELLHSEEIEIPVIYNHFNDGTGFEHGQDHANAALEMARDFGIPEGVALFANVEPIYPIDSAFIQGWHDVVSDSEYSSGIYGIFDPSEELYVAFEAAAEEDPSIMDEMYVWTAAPNIGITTEENAPEYDPEYPDGALIAGWQYGLDAEACNIDTNVFDGNVLDVLW